MNSIEDAAMTDSEKDELMNLWQNEWDGFISLTIEVLDFLVIRTPKVFFF